MGAKFMIGLKKYFINTVVILIVFFIGLTVGNVVLAGSNSEPGTDYDPLVAQSYVHQEVETRVDNLNKKISKLQNQISDLQAAVKLLEKQTNNSHINANDNEQEVMMGFVSTQAGVNLRTGPGTGYEKVAVLPYNTELKIIAQVSGWYQITVEKKSGWVSKEFITLK